MNKKFAPDLALPSGQTCRQVADAVEINVVWVVGSITFGLAIIAAIAAFSARETFRIHLNDLGNKDAQPFRARSTTGCAARPPSPRPARETDNHRPAAACPRPESRP